MTAAVRPLTRSDFVTAAERPWMDFAQEHGFEATRDRLIEAGAKWALVPGLVGWLFDQLAGVRRVSAPTSSRYRRQLATIGPPSTIPG